MCALAASPLMMGGDLPSLDEFSLMLITHPEMLACNQNGVMGDLRYDKDGVETWVTPKKGEATSGWAGVFNRNQESVTVKASAELLGGQVVAESALLDIWHDKPIQLGESLTIPANGVIFIKY